MQHIKNINTLIQCHISNGLFTDCFVACGSLEKKKVYFKKTYSKIPSDRFIFDLASLTKALVTYPLIFLFLKENNIHFNEPLENWIHKFSHKFELNSFLEKLTIEELLSHRSGLPAWRNFWLERLLPNSSLKELSATRNIWISNCFNRMSLTSSKNQHDELYSDLGYILIGYFLETLQEKNIEQMYQEFLNKICFSSDIKNKKWLGFPLNNEEICNLAISSGYCKIRDRYLFGEVHDENCASLGGVSGHAGLFGSGEGVIEYLEKIYGSSIGHSLITENFNRINSGGITIGFRRGDDSSSHVFARGKAVGHMGFTGTAFWLDSENSDYAILFTNRIISGRLSKEIKQLRTAIFTELNSICSFHW